MNIPNFLVCFFFVTVPSSFNIPTYYLLILSDLFFTLLTFFFFLFRSKYLIIYIPYVPTFLYFPYK